MTAVLPEGWRQVRLHDVAETALGKMLDAARPKGAHMTPYLRNANVQWGDVDTADVLTVSLSNDERERFLIETGDLLVCEGGEIGRAAIWRGGAGIMAYQKALHRVRSKGELDLRWLRYLLEHYATTGALAERATGSTIKHLPQRQLRELPVPLPPLEEQRRIVDLLEDHLSRLNGASANLAQSSRRVQALERSALLGLWEGSSRVAESRPVGLLGRVITGGTPRVRPDDGAADCAFLTPSDVGRGDRITSTSRALPRKAVERTRLTHGPAVYVVCIGATLGKVGWGTDGMGFNQQVNAVVTRDAAEARFLAALFASPPFQAQMRDEASATTMPILNKGRFTKLLVPLPEADHRAVLLNRYEAASSAAARLQQDVQQAVQRTQALRRALLAAAFAGRLATSTAQEGTHV